MSLLWTTGDLVAAAGGRLKGRAPPGVTGISIDSRTVQPGEAFAAIRVVNCRCLASSAADHSSSDGDGVAFVKCE